MEQFCEDLKDRTVFSGSLKAVKQNQIISIPQNMKALWAIRGGIEFKKKGIGPLFTL